MWAADGTAHATGAARRRRERITVAMVLAENNHHSAPGRPTMARARGEESDEMNYAMGQMTPPPSAAAAEFYPLTPRCRGGWRACSREAADQASRAAGAQEPLQRSVVEQIVDLGGRRGSSSQQGKVRRWMERKGRKERKERERTRRSWRRLTFVSATASL